MSYITSMKYILSLLIRDGFMEISVWKTFIGSDNSKGTWKRGIPEKTKYVNLINRPIETVWHSWFTESFTARILWNLFKIEITFSLNSGKRFLVSHRAWSSENWNYLKLRTHLHTRTRELKINNERYDA